VVPAYDIIKGHIEEQLRVFNFNDFLRSEDSENKRSRMQTNIMNTDAKLQKYRALLTSPVYYAVVILVPWIKWDYFKDHMTREDLLTARKAIQKLWDDDYSNITVDVKDIYVDEAPAQVS
jgi:hypothetical protein